MNKPPQKTNVNNIMYENNTLYCEDFIDENIPRTIIIEENIAEHIEASTFEIYSNQIYTSNCNEDQNVKFDIETVIPIREYERNPCRNYYCIATFSNLYKTTTKNTNFYMIRYVEESYMFRCKLCGDNESLCQKWRYCYDDDHNHLVPIVRQNIMNLVIAKHNALHFTGIFIFNMVNERFYHLHELYLQRNNQSHNCMLIFPIIEIELLQIQYTENMLRKYLISKHLPNDVLEYISGFM
jgi:hypothetical protein